MNQMVSVVSLISRNYDEFHLLFDQKSQLWPKFSNLGLHFCANINLRTQPAMLTNYLKVIEFPDWSDLHV